jgi:hypothetical protein
MVPAVELLNWQAIQNFELLWLFPVTASHAPAACKHFRQATRSIDD